MMNGNHNRIKFRQAWLVRPDSIISILSIIPIIVQDLCCALHQVIPSDDQSCYTQASFIRSFV